ncbi:LOW QUALITY PROTEIN: uncharacterized protein LOC123466999 [Daphnia magna]|uniref:LOW QUALITY PROTEIN: uncharacterized protein LOC123466999 n=1 Tax=Daphnia magna TaxID=35525 RepID=UPI001E1BD093|nr:LOW QUALITY PROTEIN: uncharacterized protein LOC123466999 [Daphnia magna]
MPRADKSCKQVPYSLQLIMNTNKATYHLIQQPTSLNCIQINLHHCSAASTVLEKTILEEGVDIALIQEPYARLNVTQQNTFVPNIPQGYKCHHNLNKHDHAYGACIISKDQFKSIPIQFPEEFENNMAGIEIKHENTSLCFVSLYCRPSARNQEKLIKTAINKLGLQLPNSIIAIDINERNKIWGSSSTTQIGHSLEQIISAHNLNIANRDPAECSFIPPGTSFIDVTAAGDKTKIAYWDYLNQPSMSDHPYIIFGVTLTAHQQRNKSNRTRRRLVPPADQIDQMKFLEAVKGTTDPPLESNEATSISKRVTTTTIQRKNFEEEVEKLTTEIQQAANHSRTRNVKKTSQPAAKPFWNEKLYDLRKKCRAAYRRWGRAKEKCETATFTATYRTAYQKLSAEFKRCLKEEKKLTWRKFCTENLNKDMFAAIRAISTKQHKTGSLTALMTADGKIESDPGKLTRMMASHLIKLDPPSKAEHIATIEYVEKKTTELSVSNEETSTFHISLAEQTRALDGLKKKSAAGVDQISCELITIAYPAIKHRLLNILNAGLTNIGSQVDGR